MNNTIFEGCTLTAPDVALAFSNAWVKITDTTSTAVTATITCSGISETIKFYGGVARFSLLPFIRNRQEQSAGMMPSNAASRLAYNLTIAVVVKSSDDTLGSSTYTQPCIYGAQGVGGAYGGERWITYNSAVTDSAVTIMVGDNGADFNLDDTLSLNVAKRGVLQNEKISRFVMNTMPDVVTISSSQTLGTSGDAQVTAPLTLHILRDKRTIGITNVRWVDAQGCVNYRTFASGDKSQSASTSASYAKQTYNTALQSGINVGKDNWVSKTLANAVTFGDDAVPVNQYEWIASLFASTLVEVMVDGVWTRATIEDAEVSISVKKHLFNCSAVALLPSVEVQQW